MGTRNSAKITAKEIVAIVKQHAALNTPARLDIGDSLDATITSVRQQAIVDAGKEHLSVPGVNVTGHKEYAGSSNRIYRHKDIELTASLGTEKEYYLAAEFLNFYDQTFVNLAYRIIVGRYPDAKGLQHYLTKLRSGKYSRSMVLALLRYSKEGRKKRIRVKRLFFPLCIDLIYRVPLVGYLMRWFTAAIALPRIVRSIEQLNSNHFVHQEQSSHLFNKLSRDVEMGFATVSTIPSHMTRLQKQPNSKAEATQLDQLQQLLDAKAEASQLDQIQQLLDAKAEATQLDQLQQQIDSKVEVVTMGDSLYVAFEDKFRGNSEDVSKSLSIYGQYLKRVESTGQSALAIDLGCGRGEWLELLSNAGIHGIGVDTNKDMIDICQSKGHKAVKDGALEYLNATASNSVAMITGFHIIEHVPFRYLLEMFEEAYRVLNPGGITIFETPNPVNLLTGSCDFYLDPTHSRPLHPKTMQFLLSQAGFSQSEVYYNQPEGLVNQIDYEFSDLNSYVSISRDYSLICHK